MSQGGGRVHNKIAAFMRIVSDRTAALGAKSQSMRLKLIEQHKTQSTSYLLGKTAIVRRTIDTRIGRIEVNP